MESSRLGQRSNDGQHGGSCRDREAAVCEQVDEDVRVTIIDEASKNGFPTWADAEIITGERWTSVIRNQIEACAAMIVVVSPAAEESVWVEREISRAEERQKPILPVLLKGKPFFRLANLQHESVTRGGMPGMGFVALLKEVADSHQAIGGVATSAQRGGIVSIPSQLILAGLLSPPRDSFGCADGRWSGVARRCCTARPLVRRGTAPQPGRSRRDLA